MDRMLETIDRMIDVAGMVALNVIEKWSELSALATIIALAARFLGF